MYERSNRNIWSFLYLKKILITNIIKYYQKIKENKAKC